MMSQYLSATPCRTAISRALALARTLKPMIGAPDAPASVTSLSVMPPTPECSTRALMSSVEILLIEPTIASTEPCVSALTTSGYSIACLRSEEHTSELQSLMRISYAVFCLTKKKHKIKYTTITRINDHHT